MGFPKPVHVRMQYRNGVERVTGTEQEDIIVSEGMVFVQLLHIIFTSYPGIEKEYPAGALGLTVNGVPPDVYDELHENDIVLITGSKNIKIVH